jgi:hypothetical protein
MSETLTYLRPLIGMVVGGAAGYAVYRFVGCATGTCPITSNPWMSVFFWAVIGGLAAGR